MQNQLLKQENFEKQLTNQVAQESGSRIFLAGRISTSLFLSLSLSLFLRFSLWPVNGVTFPAYFRRYETIFSKRCLLFSNEEVTLLLHKLGSQENTKNTNLIQPKKKKKKKNYLTKRLKRCFGFSTNVIEFKYHQTGKWGFRRYGQRRYG